MTGSTDAVTAIRRQFVPEGLKTKEGIASFLNDRVQIAYDQMALEGEGFETALRIAVGHKADERSWKYLFASYGETAIVKGFVISLLEKIKTEVKRIADRDAYAQALGVAG